MLAKNTGDKAIGFGKLILLPGSADELPAGYDEKHPTVRFYLKKGWLETVASKAEPGTKTDGDENKDGTDAQGKNADELLAKIKALATMNLESLQTLATELGVEFKPADTKETLKQKIAEKYQAE